MADPFQFDLVSPERLLMSEKVTQVVVPGSEGQFTVLIGHAPVMTTLRPGVVDVTLATGKRERIFVRGGFADVNAGGLTVLAEQAIPLGDLDPEMIAKEIRDAEEDVAAGEPARGSRWAVGQFLAGVGRGAAGARGWKVHVVTRRRFMRSSSSRIRLAAPTVMAASATLNAGKYQLPW